MNRITTIPAWHDTVRPLSAAAAFAMLIGLASLTVSFAVGVVVAAEQLATNALKQPSDSIAANMEVDQERLISVNVDFSRVSDTSRDEEFPGDAAVFIEQWSELGDLSNVPIIAEPTPAMHSVKQAVMAGRPIPRATLLAAVLDLDARHYAANILQSNAPRDVREIREHIDSRLTVLARLLKEAGNKPGNQLAAAKANLFRGKTMVYQRDSASVTEALLSDRLQCQSSTLATIATLWAANVHHKTALVFTPNHVQPAVLDQRGRLHVVEATESSDTVETRPMKKLVGFHASIVDAESILAAAVAAKMGVSGRRIDDLIAKALLVQAHSETNVELETSEREPSLPSWANAAMNIDPGDVAPETCTSDVSFEELEPAESSNPLDWATHETKPTANGIDKLALGNALKPLAAFNLLDDTETADNNTSIRLFQDDDSGPRRNIREPLSNPTGGPRWESIGLRDVRCAFTSRKLIRAVRTDVHRCRSGLGRNPEACARAKELTAKLQCSGSEGWQSLLD
ncbi:MAG: hypothetical protein RIT45_1653 [Pseudomonadota bacterium]